jgi:hypothetical protein
MKIKECKSQPLLFTGNEHHRPHILSCEAGYWPHVQETVHL